MSRNSKRHIIVFILLISIFIGFIVYREHKFNLHTAKDLISESKTVSVNLWLFDIESCRLNLDFFSNLNSYLSATVSDYTGATFSSASLIKLSRLDSFFLKIGLLKKVSFSEPITYDGKEIGTLSVVKLNKEFYNYLYLCIVLLLIGGVYVAVSKLRATNSRLNELVEEKTRKLRSSEEELKFTLNSIGDGVVAVDFDKLVQQINPAAKRILNISSDNCLGEKITDLIKLNQKDPNNPILSLSTPNINKEISLIGSIVVEGKVKTLDINASPIIEENGVQTGVVYVFSDITEKIELEERMRQSQKLESIGRLAGGVAHDFNNMLGGIVGPAELLYAELTGEQRNLVEIIIESGESAAELTRKLLAFSRKGKVESIPVDVNAAIKSAVSILKHTINRKIDIETNLEEFTATVAGDQNQLQSVFLNLGINSYHAIEGEGYIIFSSRQVVLDEKQCQLSEFELSPGEYIEVSVEDNGCGIKAENIKKIFEPFFTTKKHGKGTGLGLAACYGTIHEHHGAINVRSEEGNGACFKILLPISVDNEIVKNSDVSSIVKGKGCILVVDDEAIIRKSAGLMLKKIGYSTIFATDGIEAINVYKDNKEEIDLVILDVIMPKADGRECFQMLREYDPHVKVIFASGFSRDNEVDNIGGYAINGYLRKPYKLKELSEICAKAIAR